MHFSSASLVVVFISQISSVQILRVWLSNCTKHSLNTSLYSASSVFCYWMHSALYRHARCVYLCGLCICEITGVLQGSDSELQEERTACAGRRDTDSMTYQCCIVRRQCHSSPKHSLAPRKWSKMSVTEQYGSCKDFLSFVCKRKRKKGKTL